ncbi:MAG: hypothetical protein ACD_71C00179G0016 [uncultured bacterium (gcode 4)]|uniref:Radical SAM protein n=1 Tax=uncultured bacterium (gcode 4) TaxID=1234023 RepID=K1Z4W0_9BACT|nr:MAG: hypothetical protein ACD_71C00179G0016 [uncultured bacterium (gcode 4)]
MKIYRDSRLKDTDTLKAIIKNIQATYTKADVIKYDSYHEISPFCNIWELWNLNLTSYKANILDIRNNFLFLKKWSNLIVDDFHWGGFQSMGVWRERWYQVFNVKIWQNCNLGCKYCYLLDSNKLNPELTIYCNVKEEVTKFLEDFWKEKKMVLNIGEYTDTFLFDDFTKYTAFFRKLLDEYPNLIIEARTKLSRFKVRFHPHERFVVGFSVSINPFDNFWKKEQIMKKLDFIKTFADSWYKVALKFDPITWMENYDEDFFQKVYAIKSENLDHYSLWTLRFSEWLKSIMEKVYDTKINTQLFSFENGKYVYSYRDKVHDFFIKKLE